MAKAELPEMLRVAKPRSSVVTQPGCDHFLRRDTLMTTAAFDARPFTTISPECGASQKPTAFPVISGELLRTISL